MVKRFLDLVVAAAALIVLSPVLLVLGLAVCLTMGWPPLFRQVRAGFRGRPFQIYKFRTMTQAVGENGALLPDAERLTPFGRLLRRTSLDELPELINVLRGDMSLVGPRPLLPEYLPYYTAEQAHRHDVRPGVTGLSQVSGRNALSWDEKLALDTRYVAQASLWLDLKILVRTVGIIVGGRGVFAPGHATMPRFDEVMKNRMQKPR